MPVLDLEIGFRHRRAFARHGETADIAEDISTVGISRNPARRSQQGILNRAGTVFSVLR
jgi:hypothetical protein